MVHRRVLRHKREEIPGHWRELPNKVRHDLYLLADIIRMIKSKGLRWVSHVTGIGGKRNAYRDFVGKPE